MEKYLSNCQIERPHRTSDEKLWYQIQKTETFQKYRIKRQNCIFSLIFNKYE